MYYQVNDSISLYYEKIGTGAPLIMVHGNGEDHTIFKEAIELLKEEFTVFALDVRGHGKSSPVKEYHYQEMAEDIYEFIKGLGINKPVFYGFSDGGILGLILGLNYPDLFAKLIISGANTEPAGLKKGWLRIFKIMYGLTKSAQIKMLLDEPDITTQQLETIQVKTYVVAGKRDLIRESHTKMIAEHIPDSTLIILPKESHGSYIVHNRKIADIILDCK